MYVVLHGKCTGDKTNIRKRHFFLTEEILEANPSMLTYGASSLDARRALAFDHVPKLCTEAAAKAIKEWGQPKSKITHLMTCSTLDLSMPGMDCEIAKLLELDPSVQRSPFHVVGCHSGPQLLRLAMDIARCNKHARILIVWSEVNIFNFHGPSQDNLGSLVGQSLFAEGAAAVIVGADPKVPVERPLFQLIHGFQMSRFDARSPGCEILEMGQTICLPMELPSLVSKNIEDCLVKAMTPLGTTDWNSLFWIAHNAGPKVLDQIEVEIGLERQKLEVTRHVLSEYGHMGGVGVVFMLDEMRKRSLVERKATTGRGLDWGVMFGFGPGLTIETMVLHSVPLET